MRNPANTMKCPKNYIKLEGGYKGTTVSNEFEVKNIGECARSTTRKKLAKAFTYCPNCKMERGQPRSNLCKLIGHPWPEQVYWKKGIFCQKLGNLLKF